MQPVSSLRPRALSRSPFARFGTRLGALIVAVSAASLAQASTVAPQDIHLSYDVSTPYAISNIITFNTYPNGSGSWWPASLPEGGGSIVDGFTKSSANPPLTALILGLTTGLPNDAAGQTHVVLMMDSAAAAASKNIAWGTLFRHTDEDALAAQLKLVTGTTRDADGTGNAATWDAAMQGIDNFAYGDARDGVLVPPGVPASAWFSMGTVTPGATTTTAFTVMAWSDGQQIGSGLANVAATAPVPEPQTWALMLLGLGALGLGRRLRRQTA